MDTCVSKWRFWIVLDGSWGSNELPKLVISLRTSFKNHFFEQSAFATWSKPLLQHLWVVLGPQMRPHGGSQGGSPNHDFRRPDVFKPAQGSFGLWDPFPTPSQVSFLQFWFKISTNSWQISNLLPTDYIVKTENSPDLFADRQSATHMTIDYLSHSSTRNTTNDCNHSSHWKVFTCESHQHNGKLIFLTCKVFVCNIHQRITLFNIWWKRLHLRN